MTSRVILWVCGLALVGCACGLLFWKAVPPTFQARGLVLVEPASPDLQRAAVSVLRSPAVLQATSESGMPKLRRGVDLGENARVVATSGNVIELIVDSPSKAKATQLVNSWIDAYKVAAAKTNKDLYGSRLQSKTEALRDAKTRLAAAEKAIAAYEKKSNIPDIAAAVTANQAYQANLLQQRDQDLANLQTTKLQADQEKRQLGSMPKLSVSNRSETVDPVLKAMKDHLATLEGRRAELLSIWLPTSKTIQAIDSEIKVVESDIAKTTQRLSVEHLETSPNPQRIALETSYFNHLAQIAGYTGSIAEVGKALDKQKAAGAGLPAAQMEMARLTRDQTLAETTYKSLRADYDALLSGTAPPALPALNPMSAAEASATPVFPVLGQSLAYGAGAGAIVGLLAGLVVRPRRQPEPEQYPVGPELPVLVTAPPLPARRGEGLGVLALQSTNPAEAYRFMVFSLQSREDSAKTILFTGVSNDSLCAEAAAQFAVAMSQTGARTLLIDCNLRDPSLTKAFGFLGKSGITDILSRTMLPGAGNDLVLETGHPELYFLPAGTLESEGIGGFLNLQVQGMLQDVMERAEIKIVNTPACATVSDASRLARHADQICLVASRNDQQRGLVTKAENILRLAGAKSVEVVLIDEKRSRDSFIA